MSIVITGLSNSNSYYIENDLYVEITDNALTISKVVVNVAGVPNDFILYPNPATNKAYCKLDTILKSDFAEPQHDTAYSSPSPYGTTTNITTRKVTFHVYYTNGTTNSVNRTANFVRGYKDTQTSNVPVTRGEWMVNAEKIPVWLGYPVAGYQLRTYVAGQIIDELEYPDGVNAIYKYVSIPQSAIEVMAEKGCQGRYFKFLNSRGGYSYWLFEKWEDEDSIDHLGYAQHREGITDFGSYPDFKMKLNTKVARKYLGVMRDFIRSKELYLYNPNPDISGDVWVRVIMDDGDVKETSWDNAYKVEVEVKKDLRFNPALIW